MKVRILVGFGSGGRVLNRGEEVDLDSKEAKVLIEAAIAEPVGKGPVKRAEKRSKA